MGIIPNCKLSLEGEHYINVTVGVIEQGEFTILIGNDATTELNLSVNPR